MRTVVYTKQNKQTNKNPQPPANQKPKPTTTTTKDSELNYTKVKGTLL